MPQGQPIILNRYQWDALANGAVADGVTDTTAKLNAIGTRIANAGGGDLFLPGSPSPYLINPASSRLVVCPKMVIRGEGPEATILKVVNNAGNYETIFGGVTDTTAITDLEICDLTIDQNAAGNTTCDIRDSILAQALRALTLNNFTRVTIRNVRFLGCGVNTLFLAGGTAGSSDVKIEGCRHTFRQGTTGEKAPNGTTAFYDNTAFYIEARKAIVTGCALDVDESAGAYYTQRANGGIEIHAPAANVTGNLFDGIMAACHIVSPTDDTLNDASSDINFSTNTVRRAAIGVTAIGYQTVSAVSAPLRRVSINNNIFSLTQKDHDRDTSYGVNLDSATLIDDVSVTVNTITFQSGDTRTNSGFTGAALSTLNSGIALTSTGTINNARILGNSVTNAPSFGLELAAQTLMSDVWAVGNKLTDCGINPNAAFGLRAYISLGAGTNTPLTDVYCHDNRLTDTGASALNGLWAIIANNGSGAVTRCKIGPQRITTASGIVLPSSIVRGGKVWEEAQFEPLDAAGDGVTVKLKQSHTGRALKILDYQGNSLLYIDANGVIQGGGTVILPTINATAINTTPGNATAGLQISTGGAGTASIFISSAAGFIEKLQANGNDILYLAVAPAASAGAPFLSTGLFEFFTTRWDGAASQQDVATMQFVRGSATVGDINCMLGNCGLKVAGSFGVNGATPPAKPTITGSRGANAALASLLTALAAYGLITDSSS